VPVSLLLGSFVDRARIIGAVGHEDGHPNIDLDQETRNPCTVGSTAICQIGSKDLAGVRIDRQVEFPPDPPLWRPSKMADVDSQSRAVDEQMDRLICEESPEPVVVEFLEASGESRVIGDREAQPQEVGQRPEKPFGLPKREMEDYADRERSLDGQVRVCALTSRLSAGRLPPGVDCIFGEPDGEVTTAAEARFVLRPIANPVSGFGVLVLTALRVLHR